MRSKFPGPMNGSLMVGSGSHSKNGRNCMHENVFSTGAEDFVPQ